MEMHDIVLCVIITLTTTPAWPLTKNTCSVFTNMKFCISFEAYILEGYYKKL